MAMTKSTKYQGISAFTGMPGGGKTYALAQIADKALRRGWPVFCNAGFDIRGAHTFGSMEEFLSIPNGCYGSCRCGYRCDGTHPVVVLWDELPVYINARRWQDFPDALMYRLTQIRKDGLWLYYSAIAFDMIDVTMRRLTFWEWKCRALSGRLLVRTRHAPPHMTSARDRTYERRIVTVRPAVAALYDTHAKVAAPMRSVQGGKGLEEVWSRPPAKAGTADRPAPLVVAGHKLHTDGFWRPIRPEDLCTVKDESPTADDGEALVAQVEVSDRGKQQRRT